MDLDSALEDLTERYRARTAKSKQLHEEAIDLLPAGNTRSNLYFPPYPLSFASAEGSTLIDVDGNRYTDFLADFTVALCGHSHPVVREATHAQLEKGMSYGAITQAESRLARLLRDRFPSLEKLRFANSGTEANLYALLTAQEVSDRKGVLAFEGAYHGGVLNYCQDGNRLNVALDLVKSPYNDLQALEQVMAAHKDRVGIVLLDLMLNSAGCIPADTAFAHGVRDLATRYDMVLIIDEVMTARLAYGGLQEVYGVTGDLTSLGKFIGGGFTIGAFGGREDLMAVYDTRHRGAMVHGGSFNNNVFSMNVGGEVLERVLTRPVMTEVNRRGDALRTRLNRFFAGAGVPLVATGMGSVMNLHYGFAAPRRYPSPALSAPIRRLLHMALLLEGYWVASRGMINLSIETSQSEIDAFAATLEAIITRYRPILQEMATRSANGGRERAP